MIIITWNINGIRAVIKKGFLDFLQKEKPDYICLQEIKISENKVKEEKFDFPGYQEVWNSAERPGYSGTAMLVKDGLVFEELPKLSWDNEGRVQVVDVGKYYLANIYFPNANHELSRLDFKIKFNDKLLAYLKKLEKKKPMVICGDYNVAYNEIDLARPKENIGSPGFTDEERVWMTKFLQNGFEDIFRNMYPDKIQYTWWSYRSRAREKNIGWRIDYFCCSKSMIKKVNKIKIMDNVIGSDHCPVVIELK